jgi:hypothetical protein
MARTSFKPIWWGANSAARTLDLASGNIARSTQRDGVGWRVEPLRADWGASRFVEEPAFSQILTVRSNDEEAMMVPYSGCAQQTLETGAS